MFLKSRFGRGYHMTVVKGDNFDTKRVQKAIKKHVPDVELEGDLGADTSFILPRSAAESFPAMFEDLDAQQKELGIMSYGISITTMEEVFLKVGESSDDSEKIDIQQRIEERRRQLAALQDESSTDYDGNDKDALIPMPTGNFDVLNRGMALKLQQLRALFIKRLLHSSRNKWAILTQLLLPMAFVFIALLVAKTNPGVSDSPARQLWQLDQHYDQVDVYYTDRSSSAADPTAESTALAKIWNALFTENTGFSTLPLTGTWSNLSGYILGTIDGRPRELARYNTMDMFAFNSAELTVMFNGAAYHSLAEAFGVAQNAVLRMTLQNPDLSLRATNAPLPRNSLELAQDQADSMMGFYIAFTIVFGMAFLASSFILFLVTERSNKAKHIQFVSGVDVVSYWLSSYMWDMVNFMLPTIGCLILFLCFNVEEYSHERLAYVLILFILYGLAVIPSMYLFSFLFSQAAFAYAFMVIINIASGLAAMLTVSILGTVDPDTANQLKNAFLFLPNYCFGQGLSDMFTNYQNMEVVDALKPLCAEYLNISADEVTAQQCCNLKASANVGSEPYQLTCQTNYWSMETPGIGRYALCMVVQAIVYFLLLLAIEARLFSCTSKRTGKVARDSHPEDEDVAAERRAVESIASGKRHGSVHDKHMGVSLNDSDNVLVIEDMSKVYSRKGERKVAVNHMNLAVKQGNCFGLLGVNGAGKTTTFKMLTGDVPPSEGTAFIKGFDIHSNMSEARRLMGYTPQFDGLIELMTGRELLTMYARLRGVPESRIPSVVTDLINGLMLEKYADKYCGTYSGGNKRKLSTAVALCGPSPLVLLDEPTTGMDPGARRFLWDALLEAMKGGRSIVLTSHSMEECEALCTRIAIMVNGRFRCIGSLQHLKNRFGQGLTLETKMDPLRVDAFKDFLGKKFPQRRLKDEHQGLLKYELLGEKSWPFVFKTLEEAKNEFGLEDYSVSQTTLEQVFLDLVKDQQEDTLQSGVH